MSLGNRNAKRHETTAAQKVAGIDPSVYWDFKPGETVMTVDGFLGQVTAVHDGPIAGTEEYDVTLQNNMGGGRYTASQLQAAVSREGATANTASIDYPELAEVLQQRPDPGRYPNSTLGLVVGSLQAQAGMGGMPLFQPGDIVQDFRGDGPYTVTHVRDSGHPGKSNKITVSHPDGWSQEFYENGFTPHPSAPPEQHEWHAQRKADNEAATRLLSEVEGEHREAALHEQDDRPSPGTEGKAPTMCENGHLQWGDTCPACRNTDEGQNAMVVNEGDNKPQDVENIKNAARGDSPYDAEHYCSHCGDDNHSTVNHPWDEGLEKEAGWGVNAKPDDYSGCQAKEGDASFCSWHKNRHLTESGEPRGDMNGAGVRIPVAAHLGSYDEDFDDEPQDLSHCNRCGGWRDRATGHHPGEEDGRCPNEQPSEDDVFDTLDPSKYCDENCQSAHASDIVQGVGGHHTFRVGEPEYAEHGTSRANTSGPYDAPAERNSDYEVRDPDAEGRCNYCRKPLMGSVGDQVNQIGTPSELHFLRTNPTGPSKYSALEHAERILTEAALDSDLGFQITASWADVRNKAKRIRTEGGVHITSAERGYVIAKVKGDHDVYESVILNVPGTQKIGQWDCGCKWAQYHWGAPDDTSKFAGRMCSHALALHLEAKSRGMFGRDVKADTKPPRWLHLDKAASLEVTPLRVLASHLVATGTSQSDVESTLSFFGAVNSPFGEPGPAQVAPEPGPTKPRNPNDNPASAGFLTAADPASWSQAQVPGLDRMAALDDSLFEPEPKEAMLHDEPEAALPSTDGAADADEYPEGQTWSGYAGDPDPDPMPKTASEDEYLDEQVPNCDRHPGEHTWREHFDLNEKAGLDAWGSPVRQPYDGHSAFDCNNYSCTEHPDSMYEMYRTDKPTLQSTPGWLSHDASPDADLRREVNQAMPRQDTEDANWLLSQQHTGPTKHSSIPTGTGYVVPGDGSEASSPADVNGAGGLAIKGAPDDLLSPASPSIQTQGSIEDIVAEFQRTAGAQAIQAGSGPMAQDKNDIASAAKAFLQKEGMAEFSPAQQQELINEGENVRAANLDRLQIEGTHYEALEAALSRDEDDDDGWMS